MQDSDLTGVVDVRYCGGARMVLLIEVGTGRWRIKVIFLLPLIRIPFLLPVQNSHMLLQDVRH